MAVRHGDRFRSVGAPVVEPPRAEKTDDAGARSLEMMLAELQSLDYANDDAARIDRLALLERLRGAVAAAQAVESVEFEESQVAEHRESGVPERSVGRGVGDQVGLARKLSPARGSQELGWMRALVKEMRHTYRLLAAGVISEQAARAMVSETAELTVDDRKRVDADLADDLSRMTVREVRSAARKIAYALDPEAAVRRGRKSRKDRRVSMRPAPDTMALLTGFVPVEQGVAAWASLDRHVQTVKASGDERSRGQIMADTFIERLTGQASAAAVPVEVGVTMPADTFTGEDDEPADVGGYGPVPADIARDLVHRTDREADGADCEETTSASARRDGGAADESCAQHAEPGAWSAETVSDPDTARVDRPSAGPAAGPDPGRYGGPSADPLSGQDPDAAAEAWSDEVAAWVRRVVEDPESGVVTHVESRRRRFTGSLARLIRARDRVCRTPGCGAPIRHLDHIRPYRVGGETSSENGQGLCEHCSYVKEAPGWQTTVVDTSPHTTIVTTPTGHTYVSRPPPAGGPGPSTTTLKRRRLMRRVEYLKREQLIANLPSSGDPDP